MEESTYKGTYYYAYVNEKDIVEEVLTLPSLLQDPSYIQIEDLDMSLIGKRYNRETGKFEDPIYYYAFINSKGIVIDIFSSEEEKVQDDLIPIASNDQTLIGKWYDRENDRFIDPPAFVLAAHSTNEICYKKEDKWLSDKLDEMDQAITEVEKQEGPQGPKGDAGKIGPQGPAGQKGDTGATGLQGSKGEKGDPGETGPIGPAGPKGETGATGLQGPAGSQGPKGDKGDTGATGPRGLQGIQGPKGDTGATGPQGPKGDKGATGATGPQGPSGATAAVVSTSANGLCPKLSGNASQYLNGAGQYATLPSGGSAVAVLSGSIGHGGTIPLPSGYTEAQCKWMVSLKTSSSNYTKHGTRCYANGRIVVAQTYEEDSDSMWWGNASANYIIIGVK